MFFVALELLSFSLSHLLTAKNGSIFFLGPCQVLVVQSFAFFVRLSKVKSLIEWLLRSFCIKRENPMLRILNSFNFCGDVDVLLQGGSVVQHYLFFCPHHGIQRRTIVKVSLGGVRAFADGPFSASVSPGCTFFVVQKVSAWLHDCCSS